jgi:hypothetical protein
MSFLVPAWTNYVMNHASDADYRKNQDPDESARHYIDIDNYQLFVQTGRIQQTYDSVIALYGSSFVIDQGILPWATITAFDSLKNCFQRLDWNRSAYFAADLGHYVGDGHMPLHITANYNGQFSGQTGVHSRYETTMISKFESMLVYPADSAKVIGNVGQYVFDYLYDDYQYVDSVLLADSQASLIAGGTGSDAYYQALWGKSGEFTKLLMRRASSSLADLIYTAWVEAGSPRMYPNAVSEPEVEGQPLLLAVFPNPAGSIVSFPVVVPQTSVNILLKVYDSSGHLCDTVLDQRLTEGYHKVDWNANKLTSGTYYCRLTSGNFTATQKFIVVH